MIFTQIVNYNMHWKKKVLHLKNANIWLNIKLHNEIYGFKLIYLL